MSVIKKITNAFTIPPNSLFNAITKNKCFPCFTSDIKQLSGDKETASRDAYLKIFIPYGTDIIFHSIRTVN